MMSDRRLRKFIRAWRRRYPCPIEWVDDRANKQCRRSLDQWLAQFEGANSLKKRETISLIFWRLGGDATLMEKAVAGITGPAESGHARRCIKRALATSNPKAALDHLLGEDGISGWGPEVASAILFACRPQTYTIFDERILRSLVRLGAYRLEDTSFDQNDWLPYLRACRRLTDSSGMTLRAVSQALWAAADDAPNLPKKFKSKR